MKAAYFPLYTSDFMQGTLLFDAEEIGAYIMLLCYQWDNGGIPSDKKSIKKIAKTSEKKLEKVLKKFTLTPDSFYINDRVETERLKYVSKSAKARDSVKLRWEKYNSKIDTNVLPTNNERNTPVILPNQTKLNKVFTDVNTNTICALEKKINKYFNLNEITHYQQMSEVGRFVTFLAHNNRADAFEKEFDAYCEYKTLSGTQVHGVRSFLGKPENNYTDGGHCSDNWQEALTKQKLKNGNTKRNNTGAEPSYKPTNADDKPFVHRY